MSSLPEYLSPSSIGTFEQCPLKYKLSRIDKVKEPPTRETLMGNFVHSVMEELYNPESKLPRNVESAKRISGEIWVTGDWENQVSPFLRGMEMREFRWNSWWCIENIFSMEDSESVNIKGIERELNTTIGGVRIKGFIDRWSEMDGRDVISDYKTGKTPRAQYMDDKFFQLVVYYVALSQEETLRDPILELLYVKDKQRKSLEPTPEMCAEAIDRIVSVNVKIQACATAETWEATPNSLCNWCFYKYNGCTYYVKK